MDDTDSREEFVRVLLTIAREDREFRNRLKRIVAAEIQGSEVQAEPIF